MSANGKTATASWGRVLAVWLGAAIVIVIVSEAVAVFSFKLGHWIGGPGINVQQWDELRRPGSFEWSRGVVQAWTIAWTALGAVLAVIAAWPILRRVSNPAIIGMAASIPVLALFVTGADNLRFSVVGDDAGRFVNLLALLALYGTTLLFVAIALWKRRPQSA